MAVRQPGGTCRRASVPRRADWGHEIPLSCGARDGSTLRAALWVQPNYFPNKMSLSSACPSKQELEMYGGFGVTKNCYSLPPPLSISKCNLKSFLGICAIKSKINVSAEYLVLNLHEFEGTHFLFVDIVQKRIAFCKEINI